jgi:hypothetical protein
VRGAIVVPTAVGGDCGGDGWMQCPLMQQRREVDWRESLRLAGLFFSFLELM